MHGLDVVQASLEMVCCLAPPREVRDRPDVRAKVEQAPAEPIPGVPGPDRRQLEDLLAA